MLVVLNLPLVGIWIAADGALPDLFPAIPVFCCIGTYTLNNNHFLCLLTAVFAVVGYCLVKLSNRTRFATGFISGR